jgi:hypothetical protein
MPVTAPIKPTTIARDVEDNELPETPYSWEMQARGDSVHRRPVVKDSRVRVRRAFGKADPAALKGRA